MKSELASNVLQHKPQRVKRDNISRCERILDVSRCCMSVHGDTVPVYLWKHVHHSELVMTLSMCVSQDLKKASEHGSFLSR